MLDFGCGVGALANFVPTDRYLGTDHDQESLNLSRAAHPDHQFCVPSAVDGTFDTVVALAVLEHAADPVAFVARLAEHVAPDGTLVLTTPNPAFERVHQLAVRFRLASREADEDHEEMLDLPATTALVTNAGLTVSIARRFLAGMNQLVVAQKPTLGNT